MFRFSFAAAGLAMVLASAAGADPIEGIWKTEPDDGAYAHVSIERCGQAFCGTIIRTFNSSGEYQSPNIGKRMVRDMVPKGSGKYQGQVWRPSNGKVYLGKADVSGTAMKLSGCVAGGLICAKQAWTRVE